MRSHLVLTVLALCAFASAATYTITLNAVSFDDDAIPNSGINQGDTVTWLWASGTHTLLEASENGCVSDVGASGYNFVSQTANSPPFNYSVTFGSVGGSRAALTFFYYCSIHCTGGVGMKGQFVVKGTPTASVVPSQTPTPSTTGGGGLYPPPVPAECLLLLPTARCQKVRQVRSDVGEYCGWCQEASEDLTWYYCSGSNVGCASGSNGIPVCTKYETARIGEACGSETVCVQEPFETECLMGQSPQVCGGEDVFYPSEACAAKDTLEDDSNGCARGDCINGQCDFVAAGASCTLKSSYCQPGYFCDGLVCSARVAGGNDCPDLALGDTFGGCEFDAGCRRVSGGQDQCTDFGSVAENGACDDSYDNLMCEPGLRCEDDVCRADTSDGSVCTYGQDCANGYGSCICDWSSGEARCYSRVSRSLAAARIGALKCTQTQGCLPSTDFFPDGCLAKRCFTPVAAVIAASKDEEAYQFSFYGLKGLSAASELRLAAVVVVVATLAALLAF